MKDMATKPEEVELLQKPKKDMKTSNNITKEDSKHNNKNSMPVADGDSEDMTEGSTLVDMLQSIMVFTLIAMHYCLTRPIRIQRMMIALAEVMWMTMRNGIPKTTTMRMTMIIAKKTSSAFC
jgi:hypothetical protein